MLFLRRCSKFLAHSTLTLLLVFILYKKYHFSISKSKPGNDHENGRVYVVGSIFIA